MSSVNQTWNVINAYSSSPIYLFASCCNLGRLLYYNCMIDSNVNNIFTFVLVYCKRTAISFKSEFQIKSQ